VRIALAHARLSLLVVIAAVVRVEAALPLVIDDPLQQPGGGFGRALAVVDGGLAVGAPGEPFFDVAEAGVVQLFTSGGVLVRRLTATNPVAGARLGTALATTAGVVYASAPGDVPIGVGGLGAVYVFDATTGRVSRVVRSPDPNATTVPVGGVAPPVDGVPSSLSPFPVALGFGRALAVSGDTLVVGAPDSIVDDVPGAGIVYLYDGRGSLVRTFRASTPLPEAHFGAAVALAGERLVIGVPGAPCAGTEDVGAVQLFDVGTGAALRTLCATVATQGAAVGFSVGVIDGLVFAGAPGERVAGGDVVGAVHLFDPDTGALLRTLTPPGLPSRTRFGAAAVAADGDILVGADGTPVAGVAEAGAAFLVDPVTTAVRTKFLPTDPRPGGAFGTALAVNGTTIAIGEPAPDPASGPGRTYVFGSAAGAPGPGARPTSRRPVSAAPLPVTCPTVATAAAIQCRLAVLAAQVGPRLGRPLRRALRETRAGDATDGGRRALAFRHAARSVDAFTRVLSARAARLGISVDARDGLLSVAGSLEADLFGLAGGP
jgi:hypothetical protein